MTNGRMCLAILTSAPLMAAPALAAPSVSLVEARLTKVEDVTGMPGVPRICIDAECQVMIDGSYRTTFTIVKKLAGTKPPKTISVLRASARPRVGVSFYLIISYSADGPKIEWLGSSRDGLCMDRETAQQFHVQDALARHPCRTN